MGSFIHTSLDRFMASKELLHIVASCLLEPQTSVPWPCYLQSLKLDPVRTFDDTNQYNQAIHSATRHNHHQLQQHFFEFNPLECHTDYDVDDIQQANNDDHQHHQYCLQKSDISNDTNQISSMSDLLALARTCRRWYSVAIPLVWEKVWFNISFKKDFSSTIQNHHHHQTYKMIHRFFEHHFEKSTKTRLTLVSPSPLSDIPLSSQGTLLSHIRYLEFPRNVLLSLDQVQMLAGRQELLGLKSLVMGVDILLNSWNKLQSSCKSGDSGGGGGGDGDDDFLLTYGGLMDWLLFSCKWFSSLISFELHQVVDATVIDDTLSKISQNNFIRPVHSKSTALKSMDLQEFKCWMDSPGLETLEWIMKTCPKLTKLSIKGSIVCHQDLDAGFFDNREMNNGKNEEDECMNEKSLVSQYGFKKMETLQTLLGQACVQNLQHLSIPDFYFQQENGGNDDYSEGTLPSSPLSSPLDEIIKRHGPTLFKLQVSGSLFLQPRSHPSFIDSNPWCSWLQYLNSSCLESLSLSNLDLGPGQLLEMILHNTNNGFPALKSLQLANLFSSPDLDEMIQICAEIENTLESFCFKTNPSSLFSSHSLSSPRPLRTKSRLIQSLKTCRKLRVLNLELPCNDIVQFEEILKFHRDDSLELLDSSPSQCIWPYLETFQLRCSHSDSDISHMMSSSSSSYTTPSPSLLLPGSQNSIDTLMAACSLVQSLDTEIKRQGGTCEQDDLQDPDYSTMMNKIKRRRLI